VLFEIPPVIIVCAQREYPVKKNNHKTQKINTILELMSLAFIET
jgi:hypothetical protein